MLLKFHVGKVVCYLRTNKHTYYFEFQKQESRVILNVEGLNDCKRVDKKITKV